MGSPLHDGSRSDPSRFRLWTDNARDELASSRRYIQVTDITNTWSAIRFGRASVADRKIASCLWSSAAAHLSGQDDTLVRVAPLLELVPNWAKPVSSEPDGETRRQLRLHEATGRPVGSERFVKRLQRLLGRELRPGQPGRKKKAKGN